MNQLRCRLESDRSILEPLVSPHINEEDLPRVVIALSDELKKVIADAKAALNPETDRDDLNFLTICESCSSLAGKDEPPPLCIDGDALEKAISNKTGSPRHQSADMVVFTTGANEPLVAHMAEAKLGEKQNERPKFPKRIELQRKFDTLIARLQDHVSFGDKLFFIVPKSSFEGQRHRVRHWNDANEFSPRKLVCLCARAFLDLFSFSCEKVPACETPLSDEARA